MKTRYEILIIAIALLLGAVSCNDGFLDCYPSDEMTDANFWQTEEHIKSVANTFSASLQGKYWMNIILIESIIQLLNTSFYLNC